ncbi:hypothetical protein DFH27DRAFT_645076 [Peziza echinospora]|nr:hypothetical protein DFH27DRAFT_645076 [Peziza echinospora]
MSYSKTATVIDGTGTAYKSYGNDLVGLPSQSVLVKFFVIDRSHVFPPRKALPSPKQQQKQPDPSLDPGIQDLGHLTGYSPIPLPTAPHLRSLAPHRIFIPNNEIQRDLPRMLPSPLNHNHTATAQFPHHNNIINIRILRRRPHYHCLRPSSQDLGLDRTPPCPRILRLRGMNIMPTHDTTQGPLALSPPTSTSPPPASPPPRPPSEPQPSQLLTRYQGLVDVPTPPPSRPRAYSDSIVCPRARMYISAQITPRYTAQLPSRSTPDQSSGKRTSYQSRGRATLQHILHRTLALASALGRLVGYGGIARNGHDTRMPIGDEERGFATIGDGGQGKVEEEVLVLEELSEDEMTQEERVRMEWGIFLEGLRSNGRGMFSEEELME